MNDTKMDKFITNKLQEQKNAQTPEELDALHDNVKSTLEALEKSKPITAEIESLITQNKRNHFKDKDSFKRNGIASLSPTISKTSYISKKPCHHV